MLHGPQSMRQLQNGPGKIIPFDQTSSPSAPAVPRSHPPLAGKPLLPSRRSREASNYNIFFIT